MGAVLRELTREEDPFEQEAEKLGSLAPTGEPVKWFFDGWIPQGYVTLVHGKGGTGKTSLMASLALSAAMEETLFPSIAFTNEYIETALCCAEEKSAVIQERLITQWGERSGDAFKGMDRITAYPTPHPLMVRDEYDEWVSSDFLDHMDGRYDMLIVDPLNMYKGTAKLSDEDDCTALMNILTEFSRDSDCTVILVHHETKGTQGRSGTHAGAAPLYDRARSVIQLEEVSPGTVDVLHKKNNHGPLQPTVRITRRDGALHEVQPEEEAGKAVGAALEWLQAHPDAQVTIGGLKLGRGDDAKAMLAHVKRVCPGSKNGEVSRAMTEATKAGTLAMEQVKGSNGDTKEVLKHHDYTTSHD